MWLLCPLLSDWNTWLGSLSTGPTFLRLCLSLASSTYWSRRATVTSLAISTVDPTVSTPTNLWCCAFPNFGHGSQMLSYICFVISGEPRFNSSWPWLVTHSIAGCSLFFPQLVFSSTMSRIPQLPSSSLCWCWSLSLAKKPHGCTGHFT